MGLSLLYITVPVSLEKRVDLPQCSQAYSRIFGCSKYYSVITGSLAASLDLRDAGKCISPAKWVSELSAAKFGSSFVLVSLAVFYETSVHPNYGQHP